MADAAWRARLAKALALLDSPHDGERLAAAAAATRMIREAGTTWEAVLAPPAMPQIVVLRDAGVAHGPRHVSTTREGLHMVRVLKHCPGLTDAERTFLGKAYDRLYREPHIGLDGGMERALRVLWRRCMGGVTA